MCLEMRFSTAGDALKEAFFIIFFVKSLCQVLIQEYETLKCDLTLTLIK